MDIIALDHTIVTLKQGSYLNANWVRDSGNEVRYAPQPFIMSQAPTMETMEDFFSAIVQNKVSVVVCLTPLMENGRVKANRYWPSSKQDAVNVGVWKVQMLEEDTMCRGALARRVLRVVRRDGSAEPSAELTFTLFHYQAWCDHASPVCLESFAELLRAVRGIADQDRSRPVLAHCSAGVGRAGTFVAAYNLILINELDLPRVSLKEMVNWLRSQRYGAVQSLAQYAFIPKIVALFEDQASSSDSLSASTSSSEELLIEEEWLRTCQIPTGFCVPCE
jgi:protein-tyrosine phosphatase